MPDEVSLGRFDTFLRDLDQLVTGVRVIPAWSSDGAALGFVGRDQDRRVAWRVDLATGAKALLFDVDSACAAIAEYAGPVNVDQGIPFEEFTFSGTDEISFRVGEIGLKMNLKTCAVYTQPVAETAEDLYGLSVRSRKTPRPYLRSMPFVDPMPALELPSPDGEYLLSTGGHNVVVRSTCDGRQVRITDDGVADHEWRIHVRALRLSAPRGQEICWSPDSRKVVAYKVDLRGVYQAPQVHYLKPQNEVVFRYFPQAGGVLERTSLHILDLYGKSPIEVALGDTTDTYPVAAAWLLDSSGIIVVQLSRDCKHAEVLLADVTSGKVRSLFTETGRSFVRMHHDIYWWSQLGAPKVGLWLTPDGQEIIWQSERSGWRHLYLYDLDGNLVRQLTAGDWAVEEVVAVRDGFVYFIGQQDQDRPYDQHFYRVRLDGGDVEALTEAAGVHEVILAPAGTAFLDTHSAVTRPPIVELRSSDGRQLAEISRADATKLDAAGYAPPEPFTVTAADGRTQLHGVLFKPHGFDPAKQYPIIDSTYGGPQRIAVPHGFVPWSSTAEGLVAVALAQLGYVTVVVDARGTPGRSKAFHDASYLSWANVMADDHAETIRQLAEQHQFIDLDRVGVIGHSWGGYTAFRCLADRPDVYRAAVAAAPGFDPYGGILYECYLDLPQRNPDGYAAANTFPLAANLQGELMVAVGTSDHSTWTDAIRMSEALIRAGKLHEFVVLPETYHSFDRIHDTYYWRKVADFFARHLRTKANH